MTDQLVTALKKKKKKEEKKEIKSKTWTWEKVATFFSFKNIIFSVAQNEQFESDWSTLSWILSFRQI